MVETYIYHLGKGQDDSQIYYKQIKKEAAACRQYVLELMREEIHAFKEYIQLNQIEEVRSEIEYGLELLLLGVYLKHYATYATNLGKVQGFLCEKVCVARKSVKHGKVILSKVKGEMSRRYLLKNSKGVWQECQLSQLVYWMRATGEFEEEALRLEEWERFLVGQKRITWVRLKVKLLKLVEDFEKQMEKGFADYLKGVEPFRSKEESRYERREDRIFCMQPKVMYYLNMIGAQWLNEAYRSAYIKAKKHIIFLPGCMVFRGKENCKAISKNGSYVCQGCTKTCAVNQVTQIAETYQVKTAILYHESELNRQKVKENETIGVVGVACILSLISGGFKAKRLGYAPQCVLLDYCGCENHWYDKRKVTQINKEQLIKLLPIQ